MERKIGEIFEYKGEWYQCVEGYHCYDCDFRHENGTCIIDANYPESKMGNCNGDYRPDNQNVVFKKLEKVGEPYAEGNSIVGERMFQKYRMYEKNFFLNERDLLFTSYGDIVSIEIKQNKEDMEEKKQKLDKLVDDYMACRIQYAEFDKEIKALYDKEESEPTLKEFDLEAAKLGKPVCTRDGRKARIICFDVKGDICPIIALVEENGMEVTKSYDMNGMVNYKDADNYDLMMLPEKKEGWAVIRRSDIYETEEKAKEVLLDSRIGVMIKKVEWEE